MLRHGFEYVESPTVAYFIQSRFDFAFYRNAPARAEIDREIPAALLGRRNDAFFFVIVKIAIWLGMNFGVAVGKAVTLHPFAVTVG